MNTSNYQRTIPSGPLDCKINNQNSDQSLVLSTHFPRVIMIAQMKLSEITELLVHQLPENLNDKTLQQCL